MQTFLPYADFDASAAVLDDLRLGKQRVETLQVLRAMVFPSYRGWKNHPATRMWRGFSAGLVAYGLAVCAEWSRRGRADQVAEALLAFTGGAAPQVADLRRRGALPPWLGLQPLHESHRSALVRKDPEHYRAYFPEVPDDLPYVWPPASFPRWPVRRGGRGMGIEDAAAELGVETLHPWQREAVTRLLAGGDVVLEHPPGAGASTVGLVAALCLPGPTLWLSERAGAADPPAPPLAALRPAVGSPRPGKLAPSIARPPTADDLAAMAAETAGEQEFFFHRPERLRDRGVRAELAPRPPSLVVADRCRPPGRRPQGSVLLEIRAG